MTRRGRQVIRGTEAARALIVSHDHPSEREARTLAEALGELPGPVRAAAANLSGERLEPTSRTAFELRLGFDFSRVRLHADDRAARTAHELGAAAFASGADIGFASGAYETHTRAGRVRLAHELVHVAQQGFARPLTGLPQAVRVAAAGPVIHREVAINYERLAAEIHDAVAGWGTDEEAVYRALQRLGRDPDAIRRLEEVYRQQYGETLEAALRDDFSGEELEFVLQLLNRGSATSAQRVEGAPPSSPADIEQAARRLLRAVEGWGTDEEAIFAVLLPFHRDRALLTQLEATYRNLTRGEELRNRLDDELSGSERDYALYLLGGAPMHARLEVQVLPEAEATALFQELSSLQFWTADDRQTAVPFHYPPNGCFFRAQAMAERMTELGYASEKVFALTSPRSLRVQTPYGPDVSEGGPDVTWGYHVAPIVRVQTATGVVDMVMDPSLFPGPTPLQAWLHKMNPAEFSRISLDQMNSWAQTRAMPVSHGRAIVSRDVYDPADPGGGPERAHARLEGHRPLMSDYARRAALHEIASVIRAQLAQPTIDVAAIVQAIRVAPAQPIPGATQPARRDLWTLFPDLRSRLAVRLNAADMAIIDAEVARP